MNTFNKKNAFLLVLPLIFVSCDLLDVDDPPPPEEELQRMMPYSQYLLSYYTGTDNTRFALQWIQHIGGVRNVNLNVDKYSLRPEDLDRVWDVYYQHLFPDLITMKDHADEAGSRAYKGITRVLLAYSLLLQTDAWGDVPYEFGLSKYPPYDDQQILIIEILELLDLAILDFNTAESSDGVKPGPEEDPIYGGDLEKWNRAANVIKLRVMLRMSNVSDSYNSLLTHINSGQLFSDIHDNMVYHFPGGEKVNPHYYFDNNFQNTRVGKHIVELLIEAEDPRLPVFVKWNNTNEYVGTGPGEALTSASYVGSDIASSKAPVQLITYSEQKFIEAEVYYRTYQQSLADQAYQEAVRSSLLYHDVSDTDWEDEFAVIENVTLEQIITAKYIALFLQPEVWADYRRTGYPQIKPYDYEDNPDAQIPRRYVYPDDQQTWNYVNIPEDITIFDRVWWDQE